MSILIIDDSADERHLLESILSRRGYPPLVMATSAQQAFDHLGLNDPAPRDVGVDVILMDLIMPEIDGLEACRRIKSILHLAGIPIIMVTSNFEVQSIQLAFAAGALDYITKPVRPIELLARVNSALALKRQIDASKAWELALVRQNEELKRALHEVETLSGFFAVCPSCKKIQTDQYKKDQLESYVQQSTHTRFTQTFCAHCLTFPEAGMEPPVPTD
ncbi:MAG: response regulator [Actinobacteria bacterium]|nr:response regulator [Actinomycetota bacterium]